MENSDLIQALILWYVVMIALETTDLSGSIGILSGLVGLALLFLLPLYIIRGVVVMIAEPTGT
ncbi:hypothetical protein [Natrinema sp. SYSU A 869]|uniref:hypothetical protein n=1 Tax=Natrinema sp. SYSU A 869 TaxID=2871694 RepID=UPI001CA411D5|nr:hypothetical protein [Natrinema sp. SYSU A 869]